MMDIDCKGIAEERSDATNIGCHWSEDYVSEWSKENFNDLLIGTKIENEFGKCEIIELSKCDGKAVIYNQETKFKVFYDWNLEMKFKGTLVNCETEVKGTVQVSNLCELYEMKDVDVDILLDSTGPEAESLKKIMGSTGIDIIKNKLSNYIISLHELSEHSNDASAASQAETVNKKDEVAYSTCHISLPEDVVLNIFSYLTQNELVRISRVCKDWQEYSKYSNFWKKVSVNIFWHSSSQTEAITSFCRYLKNSPTHLKLKFLPLCQDSAKSLNFESFCFEIEEKSLKLKVLILYNVEFSDTLKDMIELLTRYVPSVTELTFRACKIPLSSEKAWCNFSNVEILDICDCRSADRFVITPTPYSIMPHLKKLYLANLVCINVNYPLMENPFLDQLEVLNVHGTIFGYLTLEAVSKKAHNLTELYICNNNVIGDEHLQFNNLFPCLKKICIAGISSLTCEGIVSLIQSCPSLQDVYTDEVLFQAYQNHPSVEENLLMSNIVKPIQNCHHYRDVDYM